MDDYHDDRGRAESFGADAVAYDRHRPGYPAALVDFLTPPDAVGTALDIGCGTGQLARPLREAGWRVLGVELDDRMAAVAASHGLEVEVASFENYASSERFDLVTAAQSWHWIEPDLGFAKASELLAVGGRLALVWTTYHYSDAVGDVFARVFGRVAPSLLVESGHLGTLDSSAFIDRAAAGFSGAAFGPVETHRFEHHRDLRVAEWIAEARTHSPIATLPDEARTDLLSTLADVLSRAVAGDQLRVTHQTHLVTALRI